MISLERDQMPNVLSPRREPQLGGTLDLLKSPATCPSPSVDDRKSTSAAESVRSRKLAMITKKHLKGSNLQDSFWSNNSPPREKPQPQQQQQE